MATTGTMEIAKAGMLNRQSSVLRRWKKNWFVLYRDGILRYFESQESPRAEEVYVLRSVCVKVKTGPEVQSAQPPEDVSSGKSCMFELEMRDGNNLLLCADSFDDMKAWQYALEEARTMPANSVAPGYTRAVPITYNDYPYHYGGYGAYGGYPGQVISPAPTAQVIQTPNGTTTVINPAPVNQVVYVDDYPYRRRRYGYGYGGVGTGFLAGAVLGSAMMYPYYW